jgi:hypothetical protein
VGFSLDCFLVCKGLLRMFAATVPGPPDPSSSPPGSVLLRGMPVVCLMPVSHTRSLLPTY